MAWSFAAHQLLFPPWTCLVLGLKPWVCFVLPLTCISTSGWLWEMPTKPPKISLVATFLGSLGGALVPHEYDGTRWNGNRVIDWGMQNTQACSGSELNTKVKFSDHKVFGLNCVT